jgi:hypothetical protein
MKIDGEIVDYDYYYYNSKYKLFVDDYDDDDR